MELLKDEIEDINRNVELRVKISKCLARCIESEKKILRGKLHELYTWKSADKATVETIRMELTRQLCVLNKEKRTNKLNLWKDKVFEKRDRRQLLFEYKSLSWMNDLAFKNGKEKGIKCQVNYFFSALLTVIYSSRSGIPVAAKSKIALVP